MLCFTVHVKGEWLTVPCKDPSYNIQWLGQEALRCYMKAKADGGGRGCTEDIKFLVKCCQGQSLLDPNDAIKDVLQDKDFIQIGSSDQTQICAIRRLQGGGWSGQSCASGKEWLRKLGAMVNKVTVVTLVSVAQLIRGIRGLTVIYSSFLNVFFLPIQYIYVDGNSLSAQQLVQLSKGTYKIKLTTESERRVKKSRELVERIITEGQVVYGINTGFGKFARTVIAPDKLVELQENVIHSAAVGVGEPLSLERCRMLLALRINVLAKGYSGISLETLNQLVEAFNASCLSYVPEKGTVGASADLAPLAHLALGLMGEGKMWSPKSGWADAKYVLQAHGLQPISLKAKEGLSLINGTQMITSLGAEAVERATAIARQADIIAALTLEVLKSTTRAFDSGIHELRPHQGQMEVAARMRSVLDSDIHGSEISESHRLCDRVQDAYTLRCCPQVHGLVNDTIAFVRGILETEMNSVTNNTIVFVDRGEIISSGNFHGEYPAKALDYLAIGVHELASISERRTERLCNPSLSELPAFLVKESGINCGFMMAYCTAAASVSENKVLCHPSSVDSLSTSAATEDHVSMGGWAARKALKAIEHVEQVLAIELLAACQGLEFVRPLHTTEPLERVYQLVRSGVK
ncbi:histidine ammonia-lyase-like [Mobula birostris]|uniref:histidine ammonia-lyase-like n=1 Tax=Mobula birostris TaxID=1983395 RepID=UPI003B27F33D